ncbi:MAG: SusD/RagB family nutrient-binding outer membrane lipoprotein [Saprospiraceae bacterium]|nr:SusD/RagB family nutrient-binding outer membrane lipoprotein [Saprospiraceae bacterium]
MKNNFKKVFLFLALTLAAGCTKDFDSINTRPDAFTNSEVSAKFFFTPIQVRLYGPDRYPYWRAQLIHADRFAGQFTFGFNGCWWDGSLGYTYNSAYTDATWDWLEGYIGGLDNFMKLVGPGGEFENTYMHAVATIMRGLYFQMFTDVFGMIPYTEAGNPEIITPKYDSQATIYAGIIQELNDAMSTIGDETRTGANVQDLGSNDLYFGGDLQKWKKLANTLKLRMALRAYGASGADFAGAAISEALSAPLMETAADNALLDKDITISQWSSACYGDVYYNFGRGSDWKMGKTLIDALRNNNDPRLEKYAEPSPGGTVTFTKPDGDEAAFFQKRVDFVLGELDAAGVPYTTETTDNTVTVTMPENAYYVGQPSRMSSGAYPYSAYEFWAKPNEYVIRAKNSGPMAPEIVFTTAEAYFLRAEAAVRGLSSEDAVAMFQEGIRQSMMMWNVDDGAIDAYLASAPLAQLTGTQDEMIEKIATQRWIADYTDGFEAWAVVRDMGYPKVLADGVSDFDLYASGDINGKYPTRMRYGNAAYNTNGTNVGQAVTQQGPDEMDTKLWWEN